MVEEGTRAPTRWVIHFKRSNQTVSRRIVETGQKPQPGVFFSQFSSSDQFNNENEHSRH